MWEERSTTKNGHHFQRRWLKKVVRFFEEKIWRHPSVAALGDTNASDATAPGLEKCRTPTPGPKSNSPLPWSYDCHMQTWPISSEDVPADKKQTFSVKALQKYRMRPKTLVYCFAGGNKPQWLKQRSLLIQHCQHDDTIQTSADMRVGDGSAWIVVEERLALLAVVSHGVVLAIVADTAAGTTGRLIDGRVKVTASRVTVALTSWTCTQYQFNNMWH